MGLLFVLYGPSASGKSEIQKQLAGEGLPKLITATTRMPREGERDGVHYHFLGRETFERLIGEDALAEYTVYGGAYYGTLLRSVEEALQRPGPTLAVLDLPGVLALKARFGQEVRAVYIGADLGSIARRLQARGGSSAEAAARLLKAEREETASRYREAADAVVWNDDGTDLARTLEQVRAYMGQHM